ncbi:8173_t:CDS:1, partial [Funneliformis geosporum]
NAERNIEENENNKYVDTPLGKGGKGNSDIEKVEEKHPNNEISNITIEEIEIIDNISPKEKEDPSAEEVKNIDDSDQEVDKYITFDKVEEKHPNNEISNITNEEIEHNDNILPKEKEDPSEEEVKKIDDSDQEVDKYISFDKVEEKHPNNEISYITNEEIEHNDNISPKEKEDPSAEEVKKFDDSDHEVDKYITFEE